MPVIEGVIFTKVRGVKDIYINSCTQSVLKRIQKYPREVKDIHIFDLEVYVEFQNERKGIKIGVLPSKYKNLFKRNIIHQISFTSTGGKGKTCGLNLKIIFK